MKSGDAKLVQQITQIRERNNELWMGLVKIALEKSRKKTKAVLQEISANDSKITKCMQELIND